jgi:hypothetical protein
MITIDDLPDSEFREMWEGLKAGPQKIINSTNAMMASGTELSPEQAGFLEGCKTMLESMSLIENMAMAMLFQARELESLAAAEGFSVNEVQEPYVSFMPRDDTVRHFTDGALFSPDW